MLDNKKKLTQEQKIDTEELAKDLERLPERDKEKIYYMIKCAHLLRDDDLSRKKMVI